jgi:hypothetical protein
LSESVLGYIDLPETIDDQTILSQQNQVAVPSGQFKDQIEFYAFAKLGLFQARDFDHPIETNLTDLLNISTHSI